MWKLCFVFTSIWHWILKSCISSKSPCPCQLGFMGWMMDKNGLYLTVWWHLVCKIFVSRYVMSNWIYKWYKIVNKLKKNSIYLSWNSYLSYATECLKSRLQQSSEEEELLTNSHSILRNTSPLSLALESMHRYGTHRGLGSIVQALLSLRKFSVSNIVMSVIIFIYKL